MPAKPLIQGLVFKFAKTIGLDHFPVLLEGTAPVHGNQEAVAREALQTEEVIFDQSNSAKIKYAALYGLQVLFPEKKTA